MKLLNCIKWLNKDIRKGFGELVEFGGLNLYEIYKELYSGEDAKVFDKMMLHAAVLFLEKKCGYKYTKYIHARLHKYDFDYYNSKRRRMEQKDVVPPFVLQQDKVHGCAQKVGDTFLGGAGRYDAISRMLCDDDSKRLFDLEVLQKAIGKANFGKAWFNDPEMATFVNTGVTVEKWNSLYNDAWKSGIMREYDGSQFVDMPIILLIAEIFLLNHYEYKDKCTLAAGDVFFDCGAYCGDTAAWAMEKIGKTGTVVSFEPMPRQQSALEKNLATFGKKYGTTTMLAKYAVSDRAGSLVFLDEGSGSRQILANENDGVRIETITIDEYCKEHNLVPTFIKMDIEGAELAALHGARNIISTTKPKLAICVYHKPSEDLWEIPQFIKECNPEYEFYLKKPHPYWETTLFAVPKK